MDELISRKRIMDEAKRLSGPMTGEGWDNWGVYALIERQPSVLAVPLEPLAEWLAGYAEPPLDALTICDNPCAAWKMTLTKWMEGLDDHR